MDNPYSSPQGGDQALASSSFQVTPGILNALAGTKPWVRFCSIIGFIFAGFMILGGGGMLLMGGIGAFSEANTMPFPAFPVLMAFIYFAGAALYLFPSIKLWKYGSHIMSLFHSNSISDLEAALDSQRSFWKFVGIMIIAAIAFYLLMIAVFIVIGVAAAGAMSP